MKIVSLQISNVLSFKHVPDIADAPLIPFDDNFNIIIGENGSGKSTALEVINFLFKRVLYKQYTLNREMFERRTLISVDERRDVLSPSAQSAFAGFRLDPNWDAASEPQTIRIVLKLDDIDIANIGLLRTHWPKLTAIFGRYSRRALPTTVDPARAYTIDVRFDRNTGGFTVQPNVAATDFGYEYLTEYHFYKEAIALYNLDDPDQPLPNLYESFALISSYRNYHAFTTSVSLSQSDAAHQIQQIRNADYGRSLNTNDGAEPAIFGLVRLRVAEQHFALQGQPLSAEQCEATANDLQFLKDINTRLAIVNLSCRIRLLDRRTWQYSFEFYDLRRNVVLPDINSLSAGQKAIIHLVFEAYGRGDLKGGLVIIDEPEIHLHYQFQHEYLQVVKALNRDQGCQYILVSHSEALINSSTIANVRRFALSPAGTTDIHCPQLTADQKLLIRILDNTRSTYAFFAKKVVLVEGNSDRYFFRALFSLLPPALDQQVAILHVGGKKELDQWTTLFEAFGLTVYRIADLDYCYDLFYPEQRVSLITSNAIAHFKTTHADHMLRIAEAYAQKTYVICSGGLEQYLDIGKDLACVITFCNERLEAFAQSSSPDAVEIKAIIDRIATS